MKFLTIISLVLLGGNQTDARTLGTDYADFESALSSRKQFKKKFRTVFNFPLRPGRFKQNRVKFVGSVAYRVYHASHCF